MQVQVSGNKVTLTFELLPEAGYSKSSGKKNIYYTTGGFRKLDESGKRISINVIS